MYAAVRDHLSKCLQCAVAKRQPPRKSLLQHAPQNEPFECLIIDHISLPLAVDPLTGQSVQYGLTMVDQSTNWIECLPVADVSAKTSARAIYTHWIARYGWPRKLLSDLSTSFTSNLFVELCKLGGIDHSFASAQNHKSISRAESAHRFLLSGLRKVCDTQESWPAKLPGLLLAWRASVLTNIGLTPAFLVFHRELHLPIAPFIPPSVVRTPDTTLTDIADNVKLTNDLIRANTELSFTTADKFYNRNAEVKTFQIGQKVLLYNENVPPNRMRKLHIFYRPVQITDCLANNCYKVRDIKTMRPLPFKIHASRLKSHTALQQQSRDREHDQIFDVGSHMQPGATSASSSTVRPTCQQSAQQRLPADETQCPPSTVRKPRQTPSRRRINEPDSSNNSTSQQWHAIKRIAARRRGRGGTYLYQVQYLDDSKAWLPACDIEPSVVRAFNAHKRRHRL